MKALSLQPGCYAALLVSLFYLAGCQSLVGQGGDFVKDSGPAEPIDVAHIPQPVPRHEPRTRAGNVSPYTVLGKTYTVMDKPEGYREQGIASWYGNKFHGRKTSNGELYNMYAMTAAHKTLPIPSYVLVTNLENKASVIVRINDRGPFHHNRIIDLSYSAAAKLGVYRKGTAQVLVEYIDPATYAGGLGNRKVDSPSANWTKAPPPKNAAGYDLPANTFLQVGAFSSAASAEALRAKIRPMTSVAVVVVPPERKRGNALYRVQVGPFADNLQMSLFREKLAQVNLSGAHVVYR